MNKKEYFSNYRKKNKKKLSEYNKKWKAKNKDKVNASHKKYRKKHPEKIAEFNRRYRKNNKEKEREYKQKRRLKLRFEIFKRDNFTCQYCGRKSPDVILEVDHIFPKSKGGLNKKENYKTACKDCNIGKGDSILNEFKN